jgi:hypothetical protein
MPSDRSVRCRSSLEPLLLRLLPLPGRSSEAMAEDAVSGKLSS